MKIIVKNSRFEVRFFQEKTLRLVRIISAFLIATLLKKRVDVSKLQFKYGFDPCCLLYPIQSIQKHSKPTIGPKYIIIWAVN